MFVEDGKPKEKGAEELRPEQVSGAFAGPAYGEAEDKPSSRAGLLAAAAVLVLVLAGGLYLVLARRPAPPAAPPVQTSNDPAPGQLGGLPVQPDTGDGGNGGGNGDRQAELVTFGEFYQAPAPVDRPAVQGYDLPINVKSDVSNYYDVSRRVPLDDSIDSLNRYGFSIVDNAYNSRQLDFYDSYAKLLADGLPVAVTTDFISYYFQNEIKQAMREVQKSAFYDTVWQTAKRLYDISLARYKKRAQSAALGNDPALEGERLQTTFFAVLLSLMVPQANQVATGASLADPNKFSELEASEYHFEMPADIRNEVEKELDLIAKAAKTKARSPILRYERDYSAFAVPSSHRANAKLANFYKAQRWLNTQFPLVVRDADCEDCLLDRDDWLIAQAASAFIAHDLFNNAELKNQWAIVYKFIAFADGLKGELTYLDVRRALLKSFGPDYDLERIYGRSNPDLLADAKKVQEALLAAPFTQIEGAYDRSDPAHRPWIGVRLLQEPYWPNDHLVSRILDPDNASSPLDPKARSQWCQRPSLDMDGCLAVGMNILSAIQEPGARIPTMDNLYGRAFAGNIESLRRELTAFDKYAWNGNFYWLTLDSLRGLSAIRREHLPPYARSDAWIAEKEYNWFLGRWANLHLKEDNLALSVDDQARNLGVFRDCNAGNYVEPNPDLYADLSARADMLVEAMEALNVPQKTNAAVIQLKELNKALASLAAIAGKQSAGKKLNTDDCRFIEDFASRYYVAERSPREFRFINPVNKGYVNQSIAGVKLAVLVHEVDGRKMLAVGPLFNYKETGSSR